MAEIGSLIMPPRGLVVWTSNMLSPTLTARLDDFRKQETTASIRVVLADKQPIYRMGMKKIFAVEDDIRVVAEAEILSNLSDALERYPTDVVLLESHIITGAKEAIPDLLHRFPELKLIIQVDETSETMMVDLYRQGVRGVITRSISAELLVKCVRRISAGETWINNQSLGWLLEAYRSGKHNPTDRRAPLNLSAKQLAIIGCIMRSMRNKEIAYQTGTTEQVIKNSLRKIYEKLGVSDRLELALYALHDQTLKSSLEEYEREVPTPQTRQQLGTD